MAIVGKRSGVAQGAFGHSGQTVWGHRGRLAIVGKRSGVYDGRLAIVLCGRVGETKKKKNSLGLDTGIATMKTTTNSWGQLQRDNNKHEPPTTTTTQRSNKTHTHTHTHRHTHTTNKTISNNTRTNQARLTHTSGVCTVGFNAGGHNLSHLLVPTR